MDFQLYKVLNDKIEKLKLEAVKDINGYGTTLTLIPEANKSYTDMSRFAIIVGGSTPMLSIIKLHSSAGYTNVSGTLISSVVYNSDKSITITLSSASRVSGLILNDTVTSQIEFN